MTIHDEYQDYLNSGRGLPRDETAKLELKKALLDAVGNEDSAQAIFTALEDYIESRVDQAMDNHVLYKHD